MPSATRAYKSVVQVDLPPRDAPWNPALVTQHHRPLLVSYVGKQSRGNEHRMKNFAATWELKKEARNTHTDLQCGALRLLDLLQVFARQTVLVAVWHNALL